MTFHRNGTTGFVTGITAKVIIIPVINSMSSKSMAYLKNIAKSENYRIGEFELCNLKSGFVAYANANH